MPTRISPERHALAAQAWPDILERIVNGSRVDHACAAHGLKREELWAYRTGKPELVAAWYDAMKDSADAFLDKAMDAAENAGKDAKAARVQLAAYQWIAEKRDPDRYGQRSQVNLNVKTVDLTRIISDANARLIAAQNRREIDVTPNNSGDDLTRAHAPDPVELGSSIGLW